MEQISLVYMTKYSSDVENYAGTFSSFVITPPGVATFYTQPNYGGIPICLQPLIEFDIPTHFTWDINIIGIEMGDIKSMKFGCDENIIYHQIFTFTCQKIIHLCELKP